MKNWSALISMGLLRPTIATRVLAVLIRNLVLAVVALATVPVHAALITFTFSGEITSVGSLVSSAFSVGETVTATYTFESAAAPTSMSSTLGLYNTAITSFTVITSGGYTASATEGQIAINNDDPTLHDRYRAVIAEEPPFFNLIAPDVNGIALEGFVISLLDPTNTAFADTSLPATLDLSDFDATDFRTAMQFAFDFSASPNIEDLLVNVRSLSFEQGIISAAEPASILLFLGGLTGLVLTKRQKTG